MSQALLLTHYLKVSEAYGTLLGDASQPGKHICEGNHRHDAASAVTSQAGAHLNLKAVTFGFLVVVVRSTVSAWQHVLVCIHCKVK